MAPAPPNARFNTQNNNNNHRIPANELETNNNSNNTDNTTSSAPRRIQAQKYLTHCRSLYSCIYCRTHLANHDELVSRSFQGNHGRAYLFNSVINVSCGPAVQRELNTGAHAVADVYCTNCEKTLGWKYEKAYVETQKYKEGKYIIELAHVVRENRHLELDKSESLLFSRQQSYNNRQKSNYATSSLTPPSPSSHNFDPLKNQQQSPPTSPTCSSLSGKEEEDDDEDLMFPFYSDLCTGYPSSLSSSHLNKMRRSLYSDSTPYDWKYLTTSSSLSNNDSMQQNGTTSTTSANRTTLATSLDSMNSSPQPSSSSSSSSSSSTGAGSPSHHHQKSTSDVISSHPRNHQNNYYNNNNNNNNINNNSKRGRHNQETDRETNDDYDDTQFNFEADKPSDSSNISDDEEVVWYDASQKSSSIDLNN